MLVVDGSVRVEAGGEAIDAPAGTLFRFEPDERHAVSTEEGARILLVLAPWPGAGHYRGDDEQVADRRLAGRLPPLRRAACRRLAAALQVGAVHRAIHEVAEREEERGQTTVSASCGRIGWPLLISENAMKISGAKIARA